MPTSDTVFMVSASVNAEIVGFSGDIYERSDSLSVFLQPPRYTKGMRKPKLGEWLDQIWRTAYTDAQIRLIFFKNLGCQPVLDECVSIHADRATPYTFTTCEELHRLKLYGKTLYRG